MLTPQMTQWLLEQAPWELAGSCAIKQAEQHAETVHKVREQLPRHGSPPVLLHLTQRRLIIALPRTKTHSKQAHLLAWQALFPGLPEVEERLPSLGLPVEKRAYSTPLRNLLETINLAPGTYHPTGIPNHPGALTSMLAGSLLGAGAGYTTGWLASKALPSSWDHARLQRTLTLLGGLAGGAPGAALAAHNIAQGQPPNFMRPEAPRWENDPSFPGLRYYGQDKSAETVRALREKIGGVVDGYPELAGNEYGAANALINVNEFNQTIWRDPRVASQLSPQEQAAATGAVIAAAYNPQTQTVSPLVTPWDLGRVAVGMGSGYIAGAMAGKALGLLTGLPQNLQDRLKSTGMYAGLIKAVLPALFR